jgi:hypothetical protein
MADGLHSAAAMAWRPPGSSCERLQQGAPSPPMASSPSSSRITAASSFSMPISPSSQGCPLPLLQMASSIFAWSRALPSPPAGSPFFFLHQQLLSISCTCAGSRSFFLHGAISPSRLHFPLRPTFFQGSSRSSTSHGRPEKSPKQVPRNLSSASLFIFLPAVTPRFFFQQRASSHGRHPLQLPLAGAQKSQQHAPSPRALSARRNAAASNGHEIPSVLLASARSAQSRPKASRGCLDSPTLRRRSARFDRLRVSLRRICAAPTSTPFTPVRRR